MEISNSQRKERIDFLQNNPYFDFTIASGIRKKTTKCHSVDEISIIFLRGIEGIFVYALGASDKTAIGIDPFI
jgi:hypothetical protein